MGRPCPLGGAADDPEVWCHVLQDGRRVITRAAVAGALGISGGSAAPWTVDGESALGRLGDPIRFRTPGRQTFIGYDAERLPEVCDLFLHGRKLGTLTVGQERVASTEDIRRLELLEH